MKVLVKSGISWGRNVRTKTGNGRAYAELSGRPAFSEDGSGQVTAVKAWLYWSSSEAALLPSSHQDPVGKSRFRLHGPGRA